MKKGYVYIITNPGRTVLYVGVTSDLMGRIAKHKNKFYPQSFSARYNCRLLMYFNEFPNIREAIIEEKRIKAGSRRKKIELIIGMNPQWEDLAQDW